MKYKKHIATGVLAFSLLISGSNVFASGPQDLGIKKVQHTYQRQGKNDKGLRIRNKNRNNEVGIIGAINNDGFTLDIKNLKTKLASTVEVKTNTLTVYTKNGIGVAVTDLSVGQKVIVVGSLDKTTNILTAKTVKIVTNNKNL